MNIIDNVWQVGGGGLSDSADAAVYLISFDDRAALIDAGTGRGHRQVVKNITSCLAPGLPVEYLFLTHCHYDHCGGAEALRSRYGCTVVAHEYDARFLESGNDAVTAAAWYNASLPPLQIDYAITAEEETFRLGSGTLRSVHCPGHSPGSVVYETTIRGTRVLFAQDVHGPLHPALLSDRDEYIRSLTLLLGMQADILCEGHFGIFRGKDEISRFIGSYMN